MTTKYIVFISLWLGMLIPSHKAFSQTGFNIQIKKGNSTSLHNILHKGGDTLIVTGSSFDTTSLQWGLLYLELDTLGNIINEELHIDPNGFQMTFNPFYELVRANDGGYWVTGDLLNKDTDFILKLDKNGQLINLFEFPYSSNVRAGFPFNLLESNDGFLYLISGKQLLDYKGDVSIVKIDMNGQVIWEKFINSFPGTSIAPTTVDWLENEVQILIGCSEGNWEKPYDQNDFVRTVYFEVDSAGNVLNRWEAPKNLENLPRGLEIDDDGKLTYLAMSSQYFNEDEFGTQPKIMRRDSDYNLIWEKTVSNTKFYDNRPADLNLMPDGNYIATYMSMQPTNFTFDEYNNPIWEDGINRWWPGCLYKISPEGDSIWARCDTFPYGQETFYNLYKASVALPSGSLVSVGDFDIWNVPGKFGWITKVDNNGCMTELCTVGTNNPSNFFKTRIDVSPNPTSDFISLKVESLKSADISIHSADGSLVFHQRHHYFSEKIDIQSFSNGVYFISIYKDGKFGSVAFVKK